MKILNQRQQPLTGTLQVPGDKSISHRAIMFASIAQGETTIENMLLSEDCYRTMDAFRTLGTEITINDHNVKVTSDGWKSFKRPDHPLYMGNSGTTARLITGILAALPFQTVLTGDESLTKRPMNRVIDPLSQMGAMIESANHKLPITIKGSHLSGITYRLPVDSAQVKSAIILAGLLSDGETVVHQDNITRDHTERMLPAFETDIFTDGSMIKVKGPQSLYAANNLKVPGDISSAAFWIAGAVITPGSKITLNDVGLNPTRTGFIEILKRMNARINIETTHHEGSEPIGTIEVEYSPDLTPTTINREEVATFIDEIPLLALVASQVEGEFTIQHIEELRYKETDRVQAIVDTLSSLGVTVSSRENDVTIRGKASLKGGKINSRGDHRIAMMGAIASLICESTLEIDDEECIQISYPGFWEDMDTLRN
ncbi:3-phosphoshikimate 1-carboxyvinyltransferase [Halalkalibacillus sediminis]|uniref:3-phosphoshikimate 1-carboxyvinyltransferase n=1 Tax=Halalkalibacillus sediminis TaxID=2018042 RepID=A0A2I0QWX0_9BACI|nr:3-phosphoshikimate 1-carboxyvinyltransferase [Halalkalibacillus sediminis]PKR78846.1 3-phosphoshikimate 1-carboxyvinyltransferase [Halalkalibacillus sediminis]